jgi:hypothetical protein
MQQDISCGLGDGRNGIRMYAILSYYQSSLSNQRGIIDIDTVFLGGRPCLLTPLSTYSLTMLPGIMVTAHMPGYSDETCFPTNRPSFQIPAVFTLRRALATRETILEKPWESIVTRVCRSTVPTDDHREMEVPREAESASCASTARRIL